MRPWVKCSRHVLQEGTPGVDLHCHHTDGPLNTAALITALIDHSLVNFNKQSMYLIPHSQLLREVSPLINASILKMINLSLLMKPLH